MCSFHNCRLVSDLRVGDMMDLPRIVLSIPISPSVKLSIITMSHVDIVTVNTLKITTYDDHYGNKDPSLLLEPWLSNAEASLPKKAGTTARQVEAVTE